MKVKELIRHLKQFDQNTDVYTVGQKDVGYEDRPLYYAEIPFAEKTIALFVDKGNND